MKIGMSTCGMPINDDSFKAYKDAGIQCVEISMNLEKTLDLDFDYLNELSKKYSIELWSFHLPFYPFDKIDMSGPDKKLRDYTYSLYCDIIKKGSEIGIKNYISHMSVEPIEDSDRDSYIKNAKEFFNNLAEYAYKFGSYILVEDLPRTCLGNSSCEMLEIISVNDKLKTVFDTNHITSEDLVTYIKNLGSNIASLHVSDYDYYNERHWVPGEGDINWQEILNALKEVGYTGPWLYEISPTLSHGLTREHDVTPFDLVKNANEIFNNEKLTTFSKRPKEIPFWA